MSWSSARGAAGLAAAVSARDHGAAVIVIEENFDIGGHAMLSGGRVHLGGGNALQKKFNIEDSPDQIFADWTRHERGDSRYNDRDLVRTFADECVPTFQFLLDNGVTSSRSRSSRRMLRRCRGSSSPTNGTSQAR